MFKLLSIVWLHWWADFFCQSDKMALNKSTSVLWLGCHCLVYTIVLLVFGWQFAVVNGLAHFIVDGISSKVTSYLYQKGDRHNFFVVIGLDQAIHFTILIASAKYFAII